jgi:hypothetical protein
MAAVATKNKMIAAAYGVSGGALHARLLHSAAHGP